MKFDFDFKMVSLPAIINHNPEVLALHAANHPGVLPSSENAWKVNTLDYARLDVVAASFSPPCQHFSMAGKSVGEKR